MSPVAKGAIAAPAAPALLLLVFSIVLGRIGEGIWALAIVIPIAYVSMLVIGLPAHLLLRRMQLSSFQSYVLAGALAALVPALILVVYPSLLTSSSNSEYSGFLTSHFNIIGAIMLLGAVTAATFWFVARPDKSHEG